MNRILIDCIAIISIVCIQGVVGTKVEVVVTSPETCMSGGNSNSNCNGLTGILHNSHMNNIIIIHNILINNEF